MQEFSLGPQLHFGEQASHILDHIDVDRVLIVTDSFLARSGALEKLKQFVPRRCEINVFSDVAPDPTQELIDAGVEVALAFQPEWVLAFGGGSSIDAAKSILYFAAEKGLTRPHLTAIPTTAGTGSEVTNFAVVTRGSTKLALIDDFLYPDCAVLDPIYTLTVPAKVTADTGMDALTHALEALVSKNATRMSDAMALSAMKTIFEHLSKCYKDGMLVRSRSALLEASCMAGIAFTNAGLGINHSLAHALGGKFHVAHGRLNAILLPYVMGFNAQDARARAKYDEVAHELGYCDCKALLEAIVRLAAELDIPETLSSTIKASASEYEAALSDMAEAAMHDRCTPTNPKAASKQDFVNLFRAAYNGCC